MSSDRPQNGIDACPYSQAAALALLEADGGGFTLTKRGRRGCSAGWAIGTRWFECASGDACVNSSEVCDGVVALGLNGSVLGAPVDCADGSDEGWAVCAGYGRWSPFPSLRSRRPSPSLRSRRSGSAEG
eukprot:SAG11_NODE_974_length_6334_cov_29.611387_3_plen_129_part_00